MSELAGQISFNCLKVGKLLSTNGTTSNCNFARTEADTVPWCPTKPMSWKALDQLRPRSTVSIVSPNAFIKVIIVTLPAISFTTSFCKASAKFLFKVAKTCVSHGCKTHVILAGIKKYKKFKFAMIRQTSLVMCARNTSELNMTCRPDKCSCKATCKVLAARTITSLVVHARVSIHRETFGGKAARI